MIPALTIIPDFTDAPLYGLISERESAKLGQGPGIEMYHETEPTRTFGFKFRLINRTECEAIKSFFHARGGKCESFRVPSWRDDLSLVSADGAIVTVKEPQSTADGHGDASTRWLFIWDGEDLHLSPWSTRVDNGDTWTYRLRDPLTFDPDPSKAMVGFAHLCRFADDRLRLIHRAPYVADAEINLRSPRHWSAVEATLAVEAVSLGDFAGFDSAEITANALPPIEHRITYALGPDVLRTAHAPDIRWACWMGADNIPRLKKTDGIISLPDATGTPSSLFPVPIKRPRLSLAFNHAGNEFIAYSSGGSCTIRWWDAISKSVTFAGYEPLLAYSFYSNPAMLPAAAEVICFYLKPGDARLYARRSSSDFATEEISAILPSPGIELRGLGTNHSDLLIADSNYRLITLRTA